MFARTYGSTVAGLDGMLIHVEVDIANGLPCFDIVGLPDTSVKESRERVRAAIKNSGFEFPIRRITVNLAPADIKKNSSGLDLPIAVAILAASGQIESSELENYLFIGELSLEGKMRPVCGVLPMAVNALNKEMPNIVIAPENAQEVLLAGDIKVYAPPSLEEVILHLRDELTIPATKKQQVFFEHKTLNDDFAEVQGQIAVKRALEIAAAGGHNVLMIGPPGSGKTMLAKRLASILPAMSDQEALEVTKIYSVAGLYKDMSGLIYERPFRNPHHTISSAGMVGGGSIPKPGDVTLSHNGVLFLDELPEFSKQVLEVLRQPIEDGKVTISRAMASLSYPAKFMLVTSMNPCPCGFLGDPLHECICSPNDIRRYAKKISGPLLDRIDIYVQVSRLNYQDLTKGTANEPSSQIRIRVEKARKIQHDRLKKYGVHCNAQMGHRHIQHTCELTQDAKDLLKQAFLKMNLSARGFDRVIKVARTIADLAGEDKIDTIHIAEGIQYRNHVHSG